MIYSLLHHNIYNTGNVIKSNIMLITAILLLQVWVSQGQQFLNDAPITFALLGPTSYIPASGGVNISGYSIKIGYDRYSWLGVQFMGLTSSNNYDTLILQRWLTPSNGLYSCSVSDYYISAGRPDSLVSDSITNMDQMVTSTSNTSVFTLTFPRTRGNTNGQDWEGGQLLSICFFTSDNSFSQSTWSKQYQVCYGYSVINYLSTYRGPYLGNINFQGVTSQMFGGVYGPYLQLQIFWYRNSLSMPNTSNIKIQIGNQISSDIGYDYYICGSGDFYGTASNTMKDLIYSGYDNGGCVYQTTNQSVFMTLTRDVYTFDDFDINITQTLNVCLIGSQTNCATVKLTKNFPIMAVSSALTIYQNFIPFTVMILLCLIFMI